MKHHINWKIKLFRKILNILKFSHRFRTDVLPLEFPSTVRRVLPFAIWSRNALLPASPAPAGFESLMGLALAGGGGGGPGLLAGGGGGGGPGFEIGGGGGPPCGNAGGGGGPP